MSGAEKVSHAHIPGDPVTHYEGYLELKGPRDKEYERQWVMLIDNNMLVFSQRVTQRELSTSKPVDSLVIDRNCNFTPDSKERTRLGMKSKAGQYKFKMNTPDDRDNWWIRFHAICKLELPKVHLLPGQTIALEEIIERMNKLLLYNQPPNKSPLAKSPRQKTFVKVPSTEKRETPQDVNRKCHFYPQDLLREFPNDTPIPPTWYFEVTRAEAQELLLNNPEHGSIIIRKSESHTGGYSLSMRQDPPSKNPHAVPTIKHYKFHWDDKAGSFKMSIEEEQPQMNTMYDLLAFFIEKHGGNIRPMTTRDLKSPQHPYELGLRVDVKDPENGEASKQAQDPYLLPNRVAPTPPAKPRPDRQSLPAAFNATIPNLPQGATASGTSPPNNRLSLATSETPSSSIPSQYVVSNHNRSMYINVGSDKLPSVSEDTDQIMRRRRERFSTSVVPDMPASEPPALPPPRQRCVSTSDANALRQLPEPKAGNLTSIYNTPSGQTFVVQRQQTSRLLPAATAKTGHERETRCRSKTLPAVVDETDSYLNPIQPKPKPKPKPKPIAKPEPGSEPLPVATKPSSHPAAANKHLVFKPPIKTRPECHMAPPTSYIRPEGRPRGNTIPTMDAGHSKAVEVELNEIFGKFGIDKDK